MDCSRRITIAALPGSAVARKGATPLSPSKPDPLSPDEVREKYFAGSLCMETEEV